MAIGSRKLSDFNYWSTKKRLLKKMGELYKQVQLHQEEIKILKHKVSVLECRLDIIRHVEARVNTLENWRSTCLQQEVVREGLRTEIPHQLLIQDVNSMTEGIATEDTSVVPIKTEPEWPVATITQSIQLPLAADDHSLNGMLTEQSSDVLSHGDVIQGHPPNGNVSETLDRFLQSMHQSAIGQVALPNLDEGPSSDITPGLNQWASIGNMLTPMQMTTGQTVMVDNDAAGMPNIRGLMLLVQDKNTTTETPQQQSQLALCDATEEVQRSHEHASNKNRGRSTSHSKVPVMNDQPQRPKISSSSDAGSKSLKQRHPAAKVKSSTKANSNESSSTKTISEKQSPSKTTTKSRNTSDHYSRHKNSGKLLIVTPQKKRKGSLQDLNHEHDIPRSITIDSPSSTDEVLHQCPLCDACFTRHTKLQVHIQSHRPVAEGESSPARLCSQEDSKEDDMSSMPETSLNGIKSPRLRRFKHYTCSVCGEEYKYKSSFLKHKGVHEEAQKMLSNLRNKPKSDSNHCSLCGKHFYVYKRFTDHLKGHASGKDCKKANKRLKNNK